jgi:hypothetical protein
LWVIGGVMLAVGMAWKYSLLGGRAVVEDSIILALVLLAMAARSLIRKKYRTRFVAMVGGYPLREAESQPGVESKLAVALWAVCEGIVIAAPIPIMDILIFGATEIIPTLIFTLVFVAVIAAIRFLVDVVDPEP